MTSNIFSYLYYRIYSNRYRLIIVVNFIINCRLLKEFISWKNILDRLCNVVSSMSLQYLLSIRLGE